MSLLPPSENSLKDFTKIWNSTSKFVYLVRSTLRLHRPVDPKTKPLAGPPPSDPSLCWYHQRLLIKPCLISCLSVNLPQGPLPCSVPSCLPLHSLSHSFSSQCVQPTWRLEGELSDQNGFIVCFIRNISLKTFIINATMFRASLRPSAGKRSSGGVLVGRTPAHYYRIANAQQFENG